MANRIAVVVSQGLSHNPSKRKLEEDVITALMFENGIDVTVVPNLYDLSPDSTGMLALQGIKGPLVLFSWLYPRAAHWILDRNGVRGQIGETLLVDEREEDDDLDDELEDEMEAENERRRVADERPLPERRIYCLDLRTANSAAPYVEEVKRIASESRTKMVGLMDWVGGKPKPDAMRRMLNPTNDTALGPAPLARAPLPAAPPVPPPVPPPLPSAGAEAALITRIADDGARRWYPVIDYARCTNCMECIDFCLFGVYGVDRSETIVVEQPDNCRKGCPACSRVCPENAILFPQHKTPAIAGAPVEIGGLKIDLSLLFGAPDKGESAFDTAAKERDEQLVLAGREAVGQTVGMPKRQAATAGRPKDALDSLIDQLDGI